MIFVEPESFQAMIASRFKKVFVLGGIHNSFMAGFFSF